MSAVIADPAAGAVPVKRGKKKLIVFAAAGLVLVLVLAGGAVFYMKQRAAHAAAAAEAEGGDDAAAAHGVAKIDPKNVPVYLPLDPFVVNLADKESDRYAQIGITLELENGASTEQMKAYMPSIRNAILLILANKTSRDLIDRAGKEQLAQEIMREAVRPMGIDIAMPEPIGAASSAASGAPAGEAHADKGDKTEKGEKGDGEGKTKPKPKRQTQKNPIHLVHFSSFIIQ